MLFYFVYSRVLRVVLVVSRRWLSAAECPEGAADVQSRAPNLMSAAVGSEAF
jgi:hypothetical protein